MFKIKKRKQGNNRLVAFKNKLLANDEFKDDKLVRLSERGNKLSKVLERFVEPYQYLSTTMAEYEKLITVAQLAWNVSLLPAKERAQVLSDAFKASMPFADEKATEEFQATINVLLERKMRYFSDDRRFIVSFELKETEKGHHLSVASTQLSTPVE